MNNEVTLSDVRALLELGVPRPLWELVLRLWAWDPGEPRYTCHEEGGWSVEAMTDEGSIHALLELCPHAPFLEIIYVVTPMYDNTHADVDTECVNGTHACADLRAQIDWCEHWSGGPYVQLRAYGSRAAYDEGVDREVRAARERQAEEDEEERRRTVLSSAYAVCDSGTGGDASVDLAEKAGS